MKRADRPLIIVLAVAAVLAPIVTGGATALFFLSRQQDDRLATLRSEVAQIRRANVQLFGELASQTAARNASASKASKLEGQVADLRRRLDTTNAQLASTMRALRWQKRQAETWRRRALRTGAGSRAAAVPVPAAPASPAPAVLAVTSVVPVPAAVRAPAPVAARGTPQPLPPVQRAARVPPPPVQRVAMQSLLDPGTTYVPKGRGRGRGR